MLFYILFYGFLAYMLYKLVFNFILPIYRTTKQVKRSFRDMQDKMQQQQEAQRPPQPNAKSSAPATKGDYIDFEEVKD